MTDTQKGWVQKESKTYFDFETDFAMNRKLSAISKVMLIEKVMLKY